VRIPAAQAAGGGAKTVNASPSSIPTPHLLPGPPGSVTQREARLGPSRAGLRATGTASVRRRKLPAEYVVWRVIGMGWLRDRSIQEVVRHLDLVLPDAGRGRQAVSGGAGVQARTQLPEVRDRARPAGQRDAVAIAAKAMSGYVRCHGSNRARPKVIETTALGVDPLAGLGVGLWISAEQLERVRQRDRVFKPAMKPEERETLYHGWRRAVAAVRSLGH
jgi:Insertion element 4 transposase N-terminal